MLTVVKKTCYLAILTITAGVIIVAGGCATSNEPRVRFGTYATPTIGTKYLDKNKLGKHGYQFNFFEKNGIVYTCRGGHIDITHVRIGADYVKYLYEKTQAILLKNGEELTFGLNVEPSRYHLKVQYPDYWNSLSHSDQKKISSEISLELSQHLTYVMLTWHEIVTWFGYKTIGFYSEEPSAFSWEDIYSNLIGIRLGAKAIEQHEYNFNEAMTILLKEELENLQIQSSSTARQAAEKMKGKWYNGYLLVEMLERNMDIGLDDGFVTPTLVPGICINPDPQVYPVPILEKVINSGFSISLELELKEYEKDKILVLVPYNNNNIINPVANLPIVIDHISKESIRKGCNIMPHNSLDFAAESENRQNRLLYHP